MEEIKIKLLNKNNGKAFFKYFETEFEKDKFIRKLKYATNLLLIDDCKNNWLN